jgi:hypothetical protein
MDAGCASESARLRPLRWWLDRAGRLPAVSEILGHKTSEVPKTSEVFPKIWTDLRLPYLEIKVLTPLLIGAIMVIVRGEARFLCFYFLYGVVKLSLSLERF